MTTAHTWRRDSPVHEATPWIRTPEGIRQRIDAENVIDGRSPVIAPAAAEHGRHGIEFLAGTCAPPVPTERPTTIPDRLPTRPDGCTWRDHDAGVHFATVRLTPDPDPDLAVAHQDELEVCTCCAFEAGHLYEEMRGQARTSGHVAVELRQLDGSWV